MASLPHATVFPRSSPEASTSVVVWRRYSEIRRLHRAISEVHERLGLGGQLPPFPRATILNRFEADVVETRRQATLSLLKFAGQHSPLFTSEPFTSFFQVSKEAEHLATTLGIQDSASLYSQLSESEDDLSLCSNPDHPLPVLPTPFFPDPAQISGSVGSDISCEPQRSNTTLSISRIRNGNVGPLGVSEESQRKILSKNLQENHHALQRTTEGQTVKEKVIHDSSSLLWHDSNTENNAFEFPKADYNNHFVNTSDLSDKHIITSSVSSSYLSYSVYENPVHNSPLHHELNHKDPKPPEDTMPATIHPLLLHNTKQVSIHERKSSVPLTPLTPLSTTVTPYVPARKAPSTQEVANSQYIFIAAQQISEAQQHEQQKEYKKALNMYREGVGTLLQGVQGDYDGDRRDAVKRKTAQYLHRAEQLVARLTRRDKKRDQFLDGPAAEVCSGEGDLKCRAADLQRYRVVGWTGSVVIATDTSTADTVAIKVRLRHRGHQGSDTVAIKVGSDTVAIRVRLRHRGHQGEAQTPWPSSGSGSGEKTVVPRGVPFMVPVIRYHETDIAIYLVLKFISTTTSTYCGRRLLLESLEYDRASTGPQTVSHTSHVSHLLTTSLLNIPSCTTTTEISECSDVSSTCLPDTYLQIYSEYDANLPSSSSMLILPHATHNSQAIIDSVPKSLSTGALSGATRYPDPSCAGAVSHDMREKSVAEGKVIKDCVPCPGEENKIEEDRVSIGSDTLSGVSDDFSCSLPVGVPDLLPDTVPLPEVKITSDNSVISICDNLTQTVGDKKNGSDDIDGSVKVQTQRNSKSNSVVTKVFATEDGKELLDIGQYKNPPTENGGKDIMSPSTIDHLEPEDDNSITDTSFASITLPSFSWTKQEDSEVASLDIEDLIRNSRQLLQNVDHTLLQSRSQSKIFPDSGGSSSVDQSELPFDNGGKSQDQPDNGRSLASQNGHEKKALRIRLSKSNASVRLSPLMARRLGRDQEDHRMNKSSMKSAKSEGNLSKPQNYEKSVIESNKRIYLETETAKQTVEVSVNTAGQVVSQHSEHSQNHKEEQGSDSRENLSLAKCDPPPESSLAALLEKYSASRGQDSEPRLPEGIVKVWLSQVISAVSSLHQQGIIWGDLNPDNILLDEGGSILMTHVSRWSSVQQGVWRARDVTSQSKVWIQKGYLAPELMSPLAHPTPVSDWWTIGALTYHLLTGQCCASPLQPLHQTTSECCASSLQPLHQTTSECCASPLQPLHKTTSECCASSLQPLTKPPESAVLHPFNHSTKPPQSAVLHPFNHSTKPPQSAVLHPFNHSTKPPQSAVLHPFNHSPNHLRVLCFTPSTTPPNHLRVLCFTLQPLTKPPQSAVLHPFNHSQNHLRVLCFTPSTTHKPPESAVLHPFNHSTKPPQSAVLHPFNHSPNHLRVLCFTPSTTPQNHLRVLCFTPSTTPPNHLECCASPLQPLHKTTSECCASSLQPLTKPPQSAVLHPFNHSPKPHSECCASPLQPLHKTTSECCASPLQPLHKTTSECCASPLQPLHQTTSECCASSLQPLHKTTSECCASSLQPLTKPPQSAVLHPFNHSTKPPQSAVLLPSTTHQTTSECCASPLQPLTKTTSECCASPLQPLHKTTSECCASSLQPLTKPPQSAVLHPFNHSPNHLRVLCFTPSTTPPNHLRVLCFTLQPLTNHLRVLCFTLQPLTKPPQSAVLHPFNHSPNHLRVLCFTPSTTHQTTSECCASPLQPLHQTTSETCLKLILLASPPTPSF
ncbi:Ribosomal protein S6 kinase delta-1 [Chionoecetes opilio]|uniref:Ribosomal protein S6 kinase delta-1 n=1 Tax=Chionoecetes opilio TaxID=41210 RepID=A0A8J4YIE3_CHIOP|nr:Ribosomal protein S6 kinase delta-1 [Chionoecetes opilio]